MDSFFIGMILLILGGIAAMLTGQKLKFIILWFFNLLASVLCVIPAVNVLTNGEAAVKVFNFNPLFQAVSFQIDYLSAFFVLVISVMTFLTGIYAKGYLQPYIKAGKNIGPHLFFLQMLTASMLAVVTCHNAMMFLICWEIMSLSSFFLVIFENDKKDVLKAGIKYLIFMHISVIFIMIAFALLAINSGSFDFASYSGALSGNKHLADIIFILFFIGFGTKAGFVPFHNWLPDAHPAAPSHVSAVMSGVMIKTGIYGLFRVVTMLGVPSKAVGYAILAVALTTALYGVLYAISQNDIKRLLAYSSIENIGIIGIGFGIGLLGFAYNYPVVAILGFAGCFLHILNHSIFKELLFFGAGNVYTKTHTRNMEILGGIIKNMPRTGMLFLIGALAICALPPFNGFVSELLIYLGMFNGLAVKNFFMVLVMLFGIAGLAMVGTMAILCFSKVFSITFLGAPRSDEAKHADSDCESSMLVPMGCLALFAALIGLFPDYLFGFVLKPVSQILNNTVADGSMFLNIVLVMKITALYALLLLIAIIGAILLKLKLTGHKISLHETWGCGYNRPNNHMQYTASSYASPFLAMLKPLFKKVFDIEKPRKLFPKSSHFNLHIEDIEEAYIINPIVKSDEWFLSKFESLQSGNIQSYIKYGLIFLVLIIIGCFFIG